MTHIIGLAGRKETGKSTAAQILHECAGSEGCISNHVEFSDTIIKMSRDWMDRVEQGRGVESALQELKGVLDHVPTLQLEALIEKGRTSPLLKLYFAQRQANIAVTPENKSHHRYLLEWLGKGVLEVIHPTFWSDIVETKLHALQATSPELITVSGVRSAQEYGMIHNMGGSVIRLIRGEPEELMASEVEINNWQADIDIDNNFSLIALRRNLEAAWQQLAYHSS